MEWAYQHVTPPEKKYVKVLSAVENIANQMADSANQARVIADESESLVINREDAISVIKTSHKMLGVALPKWM